MHPSLLPKPQFSTGLKPHFGCGRSTPTFDHQVLVSPWADLHDHQNPPRNDSQQRTLNGTSNWQQDADNKMWQPFPNGNLGQSMFTIEQEGSRPLMGVHAQQPYSASSCQTRAERISRAVLWCRKVQTWKEKGREREKNERYEARQTIHS